MSMRLQRPRGTKDILPGEYELREELKDKAREIRRAYGYKFIETPTFERYELFARSVGEATDIVEKEMFVIKRGDDLYALRPEGTAGAVRAFLENNLKTPAKLAYWGFFYRAERPQKGRLRQFTQLGVEALGIADPLLDAEQIKMALEVLEAWGLSGVRVHLNSLGCPEDRARYRQALLEYLRGKRDELCEDCQRRMERNPLRVLDCKIDAPKLTDAPRITEFLCEECRRHYEKVKEYLSSWGIDFVEDPRLVRGLDYYTRTVYELRAEGLGAQNSVGGGGRYDGLVRELGGPETPAAGWAIGVERAILALGAEPREPGVDYFVANVGEGTREVALKIVESLRKKGYSVELDYSGRRLRKQMELANRLGARWVVIVGEDELKEGKVRVRDMETGEERLEDLNELTNLS